MNKILKLSFLFALVILSFFIISFAQAQPQFVWPVPDGNWITSCYGARCDPVTGGSANHNGIDISTGVCGNTVVSIGDGVVEQVVYEGDVPGMEDFGNYVIIRHEIDGQVFSSMYAHLSVIGVEVGQTISAGSPIGNIGGEPGTPGAGHTTGCHLHFGIKLNINGTDVWVDPLLFFPPEWRNAYEGGSNGWCTADYYREGNFTLDNPPPSYPPPEIEGDVCGNLGTWLGAGMGSYVPYCKPPQFTFTSLSVSGSCSSTASSSSSSGGTVLNYLAEDEGDDSSASTTDANFEITWTAYKAEKVNNQDCGGKILVGTCKAPCRLTCTCDNGTWSCPTPTTTDCDFTKTTCTVNTASTTVCQAWQVPTAGVNLRCDDNQCWMNPWKAMGEDGTQKQFYHIPGTPNAFNEWQSCKLQCKCWGKCLPAIEEAHYYDGVGEVDFSGEGSYCPAGRCRHKLPIKLGWDMPDNLRYPLIKYWANTFDSPGMHNIWSVKIKIEGEGGFKKERLLTHGELLNKTHFRNSVDIQKSKWQRLHEFLMGNPCDNKFYAFLKIWDPRLKLSRFQKYCNDAQGRDQMIYFIHFSEGEDPVGKPGGRPTKDDNPDLGAPGVLGYTHTFTYIPSADKRFGGPCTLASNKTYSWRVKLCCASNPANCGPPKLDEKLGEKVADFTFYTDPTPEPIDIVGVKINKWKFSQIWNEAKKNYDLRRKIFDASVVSWIDVDWNNENKAVNIGGEHDYVDFNWCPTGHQILRAFTQDYVEIIEKDLLKKEEEIATGGTGGCYCEYWRNQNATLADKIEKGFLCSYTPYNPQTPIAVNNPPLQPNQPSLLYRLMKVCHNPMWGKLNLPRLQYVVDGKIVINDVFLRGVQKYLKDNCQGMMSERAEGEKLAEEENITREDDDNPYYPFNIGGNLSWGWDVEMATFIQKKVFSWQVGDGKDFGQEWQFVLINWPPKIWQFSGENENGGKMVAVQPLSRIKFFPENSELNFATTVPPHPVINYHRNIVFETPPRFASEKMMIYSKNETPIRLISIPKRYAITTKRTGTLPGENVGGFVKNELPISGIWHCLSNYQNDYKRLGEVFEFHVQPCLDAWGFDCYPNFGVQTNTVITGWPPPLGYPFSTPGAPTIWPQNFPPQSFNSQERKEESKKFRVLAVQTPYDGGGGLLRVRIPHKLNWAPVPGAASYEYQIVGPGGEFIGGYVSGLESEVTPNLQDEGVYIWRVRTCADTKCLNLTWRQCQQKLEIPPECGDWPREGITYIGLSFYGCLLPPPTPIFPSPNQLFINDRPNQFSWSPVTCPTNGGENVGYYQIQIKFLGKEDCDAYCQKQNKENCQNDEKNNSCTLKEGEIVLPSTITSATFYDFADFPCRYGSYIWQIRSCLDSECKEAGEWSVPYKFTITREDPKVCWYNFWQRGGSGGGFGKCHIITCNPCYIHHFPVLLVNIMQCFLWTLGPIALVFLVLYSGLRLYFSAGALEVLDHLKAVWKFAGIGWLIMLLSWWILNFLGRLLHLPGW